MMRMIHGGEHSMEKTINYYKVKNMAMKCRLYPNSEQKKAIDEILYGMRVAHNVIIYDMFENHINTTESADKETGELVHFPDLYSAAKADYLEKLREEHPIIKKIPAAALSSSAYGLVHFDIKRQFLSQNIDGKSQAVKSGRLRPIEKLKPAYYNNHRPRKSYSYGDKLSKIYIKNNHVLYIDLSKIGNVKVRGWNSKLRFEANDGGMCTFEDYIANNPKKTVTVTIEKDNCDDYWIVFKFKDVYKPIREFVERTDVGLNIGIKNVVVTSDGKKYENQQYQEKERKHLKILNRQLSRRYGDSNPVYRKEKKEDESVVPSKRYIHTKKKLAKLHRKISRKRELYNHEITSNIISTYDIIALESIDVAKKFRTKYKSKLLADACMGTIIEMLRYKSDWYDRKCLIVEIENKIVCSTCGHEVNTPKKIKSTWICPNCNTMHDQEINQAINIKKIIEK